MMRREFITLLSTAAAAWPLAARAQQGERMRRIGVFMPGVADDADYQARNAAFLQRLAELNCWGAGNTERYGAYADELVHWRRTSSWPLALQPFLRCSR